MMGSIVADMEQSHGTNLTLVVVEAAERDVLFSSTKKACNSLNCRTDINVPKLDVICTDPAPSKIQTAIEGVYPRAIVVAGIEAESGVDTALAISRTINAAGAIFTVAEQSVGRLEVGFSAAEVLLLIAEGVMAVFSEYDFIADDAVIRLVIEHVQRPRSKAVLIGNPAKRVKGLIEEVQIEWNNPDDRLVYRPAFAFRLACALTRVPILDHILDSYEKIAYELNSRGWFIYNMEDTRKAIGSLAHIWGLDKKRLYLLPEEARRRGFLHPNPGEADVLFDFIERIDTDERVFTSASGTQFDILYISEI